MKQLGSILVVDANQEDQDQCKLYLRKVFSSKLTILQAMNANQGLDLLKTHRPDCLLLDLHLPDMGGLEFIRAVDRNEHMHGIPVIVLTDKGSRDLDIEAMRHGAADYLEKNNLMAENLERSIRYAVERQRLLWTSEQKNQQLLRLYAEQRLILDSTEEGMVGVDSSGRVTFINNAMQRILDLDDEVLVGRFIKDIIIEADQLSEHANVVNVELSERLASNIVVKSEYMTLKRKDGAQVPVEYSSTELQNEHGEKVGSVIVMQDVAARVKVEEKLAYQASYDRLTGLINRFVLDEVLRRAIAAAKRHQQQLAILFVDLDNFKQVNDTFGHRAGDNLLKEFARRLKMVLRAADVLARQGGDEFIILLEGQSDPAKAAKVAEKILDSLQLGFNYEGNEMFVQASIGIALYPFAGEDKDELMKNADIAMYQAKQRGRNCYQFYTSMVGTDAKKKLDLERDLAHALSNKEFMLYYQPQIELATGNLLGLEVLLRWSHPTHGVLAAAEFIHILESNRTIIEVGKWLLKTASTQFEQWYKQKLLSANVRMAINLSMVQLMEEGLVDDVSRIIEQAGISFEHLDWELTESSFMSQFDAPADAINKLNALASRISVDDFGKGYSSLARLRQLSVGALKIDSALVRGVCTDRDDQAIVGAMIQMGRSLNLCVIAEGVENQKQFDFLRDNNCDVVQGDFICEPLEAILMNQYLQKT